MWYVFESRSFVRAQIFLIYISHMHVLNETMHMINELILDRITLNTFWLNI